METESFLLTFLAGALGAIAKDIIQDNEIQLPKKVDGRLALGFLGGMITGGLAGYLIDGSFVTAFMGGYTGASVIAGLTQTKADKKQDNKETNKALIKTIAQKYNVDVQLALAVASVESNFNELAKNINAPDSIDRGLYQINSKYHAEVTDEQAYNPTFATEFFCKAVNAGNLNWWNSSKANWSK